MITSTLLLLGLGTTAAAPATPAASSLAPSATLTSHVAWHPGDSLFYGELPDLAGAREAWTKTAIARALADPEVHKALGALMGQESLDPIPTVLALARENAPSEQFDLVMELLDALRAASISIRPTETSRDAIGEGVDDWEEILTNFGFQIIVTFESDAAPTQLMDLAAQALNAQGAEFELESVRWNGMEGALIRGLGVTELGDHVRLVRVGPHLIILAGVTGLEEARQRMEGSGSSMAKSESWSKGADMFVGGGTIVADLYSEIMDYVPLDEDEEAALALTTLSELAEGLLGTNGSILTRGGRWRVTLDDGQYVTNGYQPRDSAQMMEKILARGPLDAKALGFVNPKAIVAWAVQFDPAALVAAVRAETATDDGDALSYLESQHGLKVADMIQALGKSATFSMPTPPLMAAPDLQLSLALDDREKFVAALGPALEFLSKTLTESGTGTLELKDYRDTQLATVEFTIDLGEGLPMDPTKIIKPTIAVLEDRVLITMTQSFAKKVVRNAAKGEVEPHPFLQTVSIPEGVSEFGYADWAKMFGSLYSMGKSMAGMAAASMEPGSVPFDLTKLPDADLFLKHFKPSLRWEKRVEGGMLHHSESSFGPDLLCAIAVAIPAAQAVSPTMGGF